MKELKKLLQEKNEDYLILDGLIPTISLGFVKEEIILYNIHDYQIMKKIFKEFNEITGKVINENTLIPELSHGQKLILSVIIVLNSCAKKIYFRNFFVSISKKNIKKIENLINDKINKGVEVVIS